MIRTLLWRWSWWRGMRASARDIRRGNVHRFDNADDAFAWLNAPDEPRPSLLDRLRKAGW